MSIANILKKKGMLEILFDLHQEGERTFTDIMNAVRLNMSAIVARLREAEAYGLIERNAGLNEGKVRVVYTLTEKGRDMLGKILENEKVRELVRTCRELKSKSGKKEKELNDLLGRLKLSS